MGNLLSVHPSTVSNDSLDESGEYYRSQANEFMRQQQILLSKAKKSSQATASRLEQQANKFKRLMTQANSLAADIFYLQNNTGRPKWEVDLHDLYVKEALEVADRKIRNMKRAKHNQLVFIVGRGKHSPLGIARIKPAIEDLVQRHQLECLVDIPSVGCLTVRRKHGAGTTETLLAYYVLILLFLTLALYWTKQFFDKHK